MVKDVEAVPILALTFDDGPDDRYTDQVLDILHHYGVPSTFFVSANRWGSIRTGWNVWLRRGTWWVITHGRIRT